MFDRSISKLVKLAQDDPPITPKQGLGLAGLIGTLGASSAGFGLPGLGSMTALSSVRPEDLKPVGDKVKVEPLRQSKKELPKLFGYNIRDLKLHVLPAFQNAIRRIAKAYASAAPYARQAGFMPFAPNWTVPAFGAFTPAYNLVYRTPFRSLGFGFGLQSLMPGFRPSSGFDINDMLRGGNLLPNLLR